MAIKFSVEQQLAIDSKDKNIIVSAGAGSGKTAVLTERIRKILLSGVKASELLVLTFTNAAAAEMKERITKTMSKDPMLKNRTFEVDSAYITTFDSFSLALVKKYHDRLNLSKNISIIDASVLNVYKRKIIDEIFDSYYLKNNELFEKFICDLTPKDDENIRKEVLRLANKLDLLTNKDELLDNYVANNFTLEKFNEYLNGLTTSNILKVMGNTSTPKYLLDYIFKYKEDVIIKAVDKAWRNDIEQIIRWERNVPLLKMVYERRPKAIYRVIDKLYDFQLMDFLGLTYLPEEYKDYIVNKRKWTLMGYINRLSAWDAIKILKTDCNVPQDIKDKVFEKKQKIILEHYSKEDDKEIVRTIRYGSLDYVLKYLHYQHIYFQ